MTNLDCDDIVKGLSIIGLPHLPEDELTNSTLIHRMAHN
jgi:hypothetical protein